MTNVGLFWNFLKSAMTSFARSSDKKGEARSLYEAAIEDVKYNGPHIGNYKVPFKYDALSKLLSYGDCPLSAIDKEKLREYIKLCGLCNGGALSLQRGIVPGAVQGRQSLMIQMLEGYCFKIDGKKSYWHHFKHAINRLPVIVFSMVIASYFSLYYGFGEPTQISPSYYVIVAIVFVLLNSVVSLLFAG